MYQTNIHLTLPISMLHLLPSEVAELILVRCNYVDILHASEVSDVCDFLFAYH